MENLGEAIDIAKTWPARDHLVEIRPWWTANAGHRHLRPGLAAGRLGLALIPAVYGMSLVYDLLNHGPAVLFLRTPLDVAMPVVPLFAIPYVSLNPLVYLSLVLFLLFRQRVFQSAALSLLATWAVSYAIYFVAQSFVDRPAVMGTDFLSGLVRSVYASDAPTNDFPRTCMSRSRRSWRSTGYGLTGASAGGQHLGGSWDRLHPARSTSTPSRTLRVG